jgi:pilus assembly protein CpaF
MVFTGKGASGKTTLMNFLLDCIPFNKSGLVIQESDELFSTVHPGLAFEHVTHDESRGKIYGLQELSVNGLLTDLDYFIIGEVKGAEAKYFITAAESGTRCWCSVHSSSSTEALDKLAYNITLDSSFVNSEAIHALRNLGTVVYMENFKVCEISEISGWDENTKKILYTPVYRRPKAIF